MDGSAKKICDCAERNFAVLWWPVHACMNELSDEYYRVMVA
jgi:hypothetical protein